MKPMEPPMYHYRIVFKNGSPLNVVSSMALHPDKSWSWIELGLEDAENRWHGVKRVIVRASSIMYIALLSVDQPCLEAEE